MDRCGEKQLNGLIPAEGTKLQSRWLLREDLHLRTTVPYVHGGNSS